MHSANHVKQWFLQQEDKAVSLSSKAELYKAELSLNYLYITQRYDECLDLALKLWHAGPVVEPDADGNDRARKAKSKTEGKAEVADMCLRSAFRSGREREVLEVAHSVRDYVSPPLKFAAVNRNADALHVDDSCVWTRFLCC